MAQHDSGRRAPNPDLLAKHWRSCRCWVSARRRLRAAETRRFVEREAGPGIRFARPARRTGDQILRRAQVLLQGARREHGVPDHHRRHIRDRPVRRPHRFDRARGRQGDAVVIVPSRRPLPAGRRETHRRHGGAYRIPYVRCLTNTCRRRSGRPRVAQGDGDRREACPRGGRFQRVGGKHLSAARPVRGGPARDSREDL
jgi:hypothetical protein